MFFFYRNKAQPVDPRREAVPIWNHLSRIQGLGKTPNLSDILIVFQRFAKIPFIGEPQHLKLQTLAHQVILSRSFGPDKGCFILRLSLPVEAGVLIERPINERRSFLREVRQRMKSIKKVPIEALSTQFEAGEG